MNKKFNRLQEKSNGLLDQILYTYGKFPYPREASIFMNDDGNIKYCFQIDDKTISMENGTATIENKFVRLLPVEDDCQNRCIIGNDNTIQCFAGNELEWEIKIAKKRMGFGFRRGCSCRLEWGTGYIGLYEEYTAIQTMEVIDWYGSGEKNIVVMAVNSELIIISLKGEILERKRILSGSIYWADFVKVSRNEPEWILNLMIDWAPRFFFFRKLLAETYCLRYVRGKLASKLRNLNILIKLNTSGDWFLKDNFERVKMENGKFNESIDRPSGSRQTLCLDPKNRNRMLLAQFNVASQMLQIVTLEDKILWEANLPNSIDGDYEFVGCIGPENTIAEGLVAIACETKRVLQDPNISFKECHILVYDKLGKLIGKHVYAKSYDRDIVKCMVLDDIDGDGNVELAVFLERSFNVYVLPNQQEATLEQINDPECYSMNRYPLPPEDLWTMGIHE